MYGTQGLARALIRAHAYRRFSLGWYIGIRKWETKIECKPNVRKKNKKQTWDWGEILSAFEVRKVSTMYAICTNFELWTHTQSHLHMRMHTCYDIGCLVLSKYIDHVFTFSNYIVQILEAVTVSVNDTIHHSPRFSPFSMFCTECSPDITFRSRTLCSLDVICESGKYWGIHNFKHATGREHVSPSLYIWNVYKQRH